MSANSSALPSRPYLMIPINSVLILSSNVNVPSVNCILSETGSEYILCQPPVVEQLMSLPTLPASPSGR